MCCLVPIDVNKSLQTNKNNQIRNGLMFIGNTMGKGRGIIFLLQEIHKISAAAVLFGSTEVNTFPKQQKTTVSLC